VLEGRAERVVDADRIDASRRAVTATYDADLPVDFLDPVVNGTYAVRPARVSC
jgi:hypothetical protein